ncbi:glycosyltransferase [Phycicoccus endophyticus]|uniref:Glycosyltransferase n=1 Tax=Phycicoccus endophyticus TaxID=1690220 RepID=A0A7G9R328_9MICO|nr:glycosyltransferase [Phycicoccus endophyticus]NHI20297.1 glycosyltransferase [Phycicoccus endophyticus]QNN50003.1 glycosyltransferase [Phycicoccus endophyticus]GGL28945.1 glycosyl transferase [Phycicoccus endophyticus]
MPTTDLSERLALVIVTFRRPRLLGELLASVAENAADAWRVVVVDNASGDETPEVVEAARARFAPDQLVYHVLAENTGGAGGFSEGVRVALEAGARWMWLMDDDVEVLPGALEALAPWTSRSGCIHGRRYDVDGTPFYWQARFNNYLGVPLPYSVGDFKDADHAVTNSGTFEGMLVSADVVRQIGLPDPRFFISWDDAVYAWLASHVTDVLYVNAFVLRRKRTQRKIDLGLRHLNDASDLTRYHVMRNRAYVGRYFAAHAALHRPFFAVGTALTYAKEVVRLVAVEHTLRGSGALWRGWRDGRAIWHDESWRPMPPLTAGAADAEPA